MSFAEIRPLGSACRQTKRPKGLSCNPSIL
jgi:hypothetical protein